MTLTTKGAIGDRIPDGFQAARLTLACQRCNESIQIIALLPIEGEIDQRELKRDVGEMLAKHRCPDGEPATSQKRLKPG